IKRDFVGVEVDKVLPRNHTKIVGDGGYVGIGLRRHDCVALRRPGSLVGDARAVSMSLGKYRGRVSQRRGSHSDERDGDHDTGADIQHTNALRRFSDIEILAYCALPQIRRPLGSSGMTLTSAPLLNSISQQFITESAVGQYRLVTAGRASGFS